MFGMWLRKIRMDRKLGLRQAAAIYGINPTYLSRIEREIDPPPRSAILETMADTLEIPVSELYTQLVRDSRAVRRVPTVIMEAFERHPGRLIEICRKFKFIIEGEK